MIGAASVSARFRARPQKKGNHKGLPLRAAGHMGKKITKGRALMGSPFLLTQVAYRQSRGLNSLWGRFSGDRFHQSLATVIYILR